MLDKKLQEKIIKKFKGKSGPPDTESSIIDSKEAEVVDVFAMASTAAKIAARCWPAIKEARITCTNDGAIFKIDKKYFRGLDYCFKVIKEK